MPERSFNFPEDFVRTVGYRGKGPRAWLAALPALLAECEQRWSITILPPFSGLSNNYVAPVVFADGTPAVLKAGFEGPQEADALRLYDGRNSVRLLEYLPGPISSPKGGEFLGFCVVPRQEPSVDHGVMLLEKIEPGTRLTTLASEIDDTKATSIAASVMRGLWRPVPAEHRFRTVADWADELLGMRQRFHGGVGPFPLKLVEEAESLFADLLASAADPVVLHGDLHHDNILSAQRQPWLAIDPKGVVGEPACEVGAMLRNLWPDRHKIGNPQQTLQRRVDQLSDELGFDRARVRGWGVAQAVRAMWWYVDDPVQPFLAVAEMLAQVKA